MSKTVTIEVPASYTVTLELIREMDTRKYKHMSDEAALLERLGWSLDETKRRLIKTEETRLDLAIGKFVTETARTNPKLAADPSAMYAEIQRRFKIGGTVVELPSK